ncbi:MAG: HEAT repeat domain-containing protein [Proteobacteria bacterium]|nr:HEAT repeat domain-containing protein [Pseudomonadota bacterium]
MVKRVAARTLGVLGDTTSITQLCMAAKDEDGDVRRAVATALGKSAFYDGARLMWSSTWRKVPRRGRSGFRRLRWLLCSLSKADPQPGRS